MTQLSQPPVAPQNESPPTQRVREWLTIWRLGSVMRTWRSSSRLFDRLVTTCDGPHEEATAMQTNLFPLGRVVITATAHTRLSEKTVLASLARHANGDWGEVCEEDRRENEYSLERGFRLLSVYRDESETTFWVITEADRSATIVLMPGDY